MAKVIVALDSGNLKELEAFLSQIDKNLCKIKIGNILFTKYGLEIVKLVSKYGFDIFLDLKFHDIPNTVHYAVRSAIDHGIWMVNIHLCGGIDMIKSAVDACKNSDILLIGVTSLTSFSPSDAQLFCGSSKATYIDKLAQAGYENGIRGIVCPGVDAHRLKAQYGAGFITVVPGIRIAGDQTDDHQLANTPAWAAENGADYLVIGRSITSSTNPHQTLLTIIKDISSSLQTKKLF
jgi:orotidine-5'-phosphate decarboxylase